MQYSACVSLKLDSVRLLDALSIRGSDFIHEVINRLVRYCLSEHVCGHVGAARQIEFRDEWQKHDGDEDSLGDHNSIKIGGTRRTSKVIRSFLHIGCSTMDELHALLHREPSILITPHKSLQNSQVLKLPAMLRCILEKVTVSLIQSHVSGDDGEDVGADQGNRREITIPSSARSGGVMIPMPRSVLEAAFNDGEPIVDEDMQVVVENLKSRLEDAVAKEADGDLGNFDFNLCVEAIILYQGDLDAAARYVRKNDVFKLLQRHKIKEKRGLVKDSVDMLLDNTKLEKYAAFLESYVAKVDGKYGPARQFTPQDRSVLENYQDRHSISKSDHKKVLKKHFKLSTNVFENFFPDEDDGLCCICLANIPDMCIIPCMHVCLCEECSGFVESEDCPVCSERLQEIKKIFLP